MGVASDVLGRVIVYVIIPHNMLMSKAIMLLLIYVGYGVARE